MAIRESGEDYLESILRLREQGKAVRSIDIVSDLGYSKPSVSVAMKKLRESGYIQVEDNGVITLTDQGEAVARRTWERHRTLMDFFIHLGVDPKIAEQDACKVEHDLSDETFDKLLALARGDSKS